MNDIRMAQSSQPIEPNIAGRFSSRAFDPDREISTEILVALFEAARWAPSCFNEQPWRFIVCDRLADAACWRLAFDCLAQGNQKWAKNVPVLIIAISDTFSMRDSEDANRWANYDTGAASQNLCLQATAMGLAAHQMGGFDQERIYASFDVPRSYDPIAVIALGYPGRVELLEGWQKELEGKPRERRPLHKFVFSGKWERSFVNHE